jgi:hypothetical protein
VEVAELLLVQQVQDLRVEQVEQDLPNSISGFTSSLCRWRWWRWMEWWSRCFRRSRWWWSRWRSSNSRKQEQLIQEVEVEVEQELINVGGQPSI